METLPNRECPYILPKKCSLCMGSSKRLLRVVIPLSFVMWFVGYRACTAAPTLRHSNTAAKTLSHGILSYFQSSRSLLVSWRRPQESHEQKVRTMLGAVPTKGSGQACLSRSPIQNNFPEISLSECSGLASSEVAVIFTASRFSSKVDVYAL